MKTNVLFILFMLGTLGILNAQTYFTPSSVTPIQFNACDSVQLNISGYFNDGCGYFKLDENATQITGNTVNFHITARNLGCDSMYVCTMALVPVNSTFTFPPIGIGGTLNVNVVVHNKCMGMDNVSYFSVGNLNVNSYPATNLLSSNAVGNVYIGMPVIYTLNTNIPSNFTTYWYRNGQLMNTAPNSTSWSTTMATNFDTVRVKVQNDSICIAEVDKWSNNLILMVNPNSVQDWNLNTVTVFRNHETQEITVSNLRGGEQVDVFNVMGQILISYRNEQQTTVKLPTMPQLQDAHILRIQHKGSSKVIKF